MTEARQLIHAGMRTGSSCTLSTLGFRGRRNSNVVPVPGAVVRDIAVHLSGELSSHGETQTHRSRPVTGPPAQVAVEDLLTLGNRYGRPVIDD